MEELIEKMNKYWETHEANDEEDGMKFYNSVSPDKELSEIIGLIWDNLFIGSSWNTENKILLCKAGYSCRTFERDSFGILLAGIGKDNKWLSIG